ncbi:MAG: hypothetical protein ABIY52_13820 [Gemmatimonadaceae bacterium]
MYWSRHFTDLLIMLSGGLFTTTISFAALWIRARERAVRAEALNEGRGVQAPQYNLSPAIDAIAMEVERIGEGQRFLTKVLSEQQQQNLRLPQRAPGSITPH